MESRNKFITSKEQRGVVIALLLALAYFLLSWKKSPEPYVEVGQGEFGDFGTDGILEQEDVSDLIKTPNYVASKGVVGDLGGMYAGTVKENYVVGEKNCTACY
ncbi:hypothetical protein [Muricauda sp. MAR_2010_75]|uniref:hypothetical protein n=1 Tax=Allomuricauda sp. MAR_2010_75 TaxID=1250232 RepID=UPI00055E9AA0|nr:hypothetical protein [Muricauda sp. MAR_2010_75]